ncbi:unnamed protein product [Parnassius apollo]|uniref:Fucosyltransferase n=1 Tax=Parnassius apollo TaxID=110799 RepID=A0A8S3W6C1_PARAO|nr:unnamed protein product [Parnassius apollo]
MGFHVWLVCKTLAVLDDVSSIVVLKHGKGLNKQLPHKTIYILNWDSNLDTQNNLFDRCTVRNCIITKDRHYFGEDYSNFDALLFTESFLGSNYKPQKGSKALRIFASPSPPHNKITCDKHYDNFFNLTFTYRLNSDIVWKYFVVRNFTRNIIAPNLAPVWDVNPNSVNINIKSIIQRKMRPVAYMECDSNYDSWKKTYLTKLENNLSQYFLKIDTYHCSGCRYGNCKNMLRSDYYFYIIFEDYFAEDYVTKKLLYAYDNYVVPIIYGGANYSRFLPPHSYIDAYETNPNDIAAEIQRSLNSYADYEKYFKWRNIYTIENYQPFCDLCDVLNRRKSRITPAKKDFREWWNGKGGIKLCSLQQFNNGTPESDLKLAS